MMGTMQTVRVATCYPAFQQGSTKAMNCKAATKALTYLVYLCLAVAAAVSLYKGPIAKYRRNETTLVNGEITVDGQ